MIKLINITIVGVINGNMKWFYTIVKSKFI